MDLEESNILHFSVLYFLFILIWIYFKKENCSMNFLRRRHHAKIGWSRCKMLKGAFKYYVIRFSTILNPPPPKHWCPNIWIRNWSQSHIRKGTYWKNTNTLTHFSLISKPPVSVVKLYKQGYLKGFISKLQFIYADIKLHKNIFFRNIFKYYFIVLVLDPPPP